MSPFIVSSCFSFAANLIAALLCQNDKLGFLNNTKSFKDCHHQQRIKYKSEDSAKMEQI